MDADAACTPAQRRVVAELMAREQPRSSFDPDMAEGLRVWLEQAVAPAVDGLDEPLWVSKHALAQVHACEASYLAERGWQGWSVASAEGEVAHRAVRLSIAMPVETTPLELVDHTLAELAADEMSSLGPFVAGLEPLGRGDLRARAANAVATFLECWPPLRASWWPRAELPVRADLLGGSVVLSGKVDLCLGHAKGAEARCLFVDLKTGGRYPSHLDDLRFYALIQAFRIGVPPFRVASYYLDSATFAAEDVTEETLTSALRRAADGIRKMAELRTAQRSATITPCPRCRYCPARHECPGAREWDAREEARDA